MDFRLLSYLFFFVATVLGQINMLLLEDVTVGLLVPESEVCEANQEYKSEMFTFYAERKKPKWHNPLGNLDKEQYDR